MAGRHLQDPLARMRAEELGMVGRHVGLDVCNERVVGLAFDVHAARTVDDFHLSLLDRVDDRTLPPPGVLADVGEMGYRTRARHADAFEPGRGTVETLEQA